jgi:hypothetical protein
MLRTLTLVLKVATDLVPHVQDDCDSGSNCLYVKSLGPFNSFCVCGYSSHDAVLFPKPAIFLTTEKAECANALAH